ncbi:MAG: hypothetical protein KKA22_06475 [Gammaproteobacteria bacterium]|nr:hypothetical protein [Gammaproteobacteria bacterium]MBU1407779.1 hypothetical protein [Gammaproteobacteria bacterium]MBU1531892.1 hypothetical protein [Gammaproteobacteria bacterium]
MSLTVGRKEYFLESSDDLHSTASHNLAEIAENVRWFTTLVIASITALAGYRQLQGEHSLSFAFAIIVSLLCLSLFLFLIAVLAAQFRRAALSRRVNDFTATVHMLENDPNVAPSKAETQLGTLIDSVRADVLKISGWPSWFEVIGVVVFVVAALFAVPLILFVELLTVLFS